MCEKTCEQINVWRLLYVLRQRPYSKCKEDKLTHIKQKTS